MCVCLPMPFFVYFAVCHWISAEIVNLINTKCKHVLKILTYFLVTYCDIVQTITSYGKCRPHCIYPIPFLFLQVPTSPGAAGQIGDGAGGVPFCLQCHCGAEIVSQPLWSHHRSSGAVCTWSGTEGNQHDSLTPSGVFWYKETKARAWLISHTQNGAKHGFYYAGATVVLFLFSFLLLWETC